MFDHCRSRQNTHLITCLYQADTNVRHKLGEYTTYHCHWPLVFPLKPNPLNKAYICGLRHTRYNHTGLVYNTFQKDPARHGRVNIGHKHLYSFGLNTENVHCPRSPCGYHTGFYPYANSRPVGRTRYSLHNRRHCILFQGHIGPNSTWPCRLRWCNHSRMHTLYFRRLALAHSQTHSPCLSSCRDTLAWRQMHH